MQSDYKLCCPLAQWLDIVNYIDKQNLRDETTWYVRLTLLFVGRASCITKTCPFKYIENFTTKTWNFSDKNSDFFHISAQNIDCGYSLEPPRQSGFNEYPQSMFLSRNKKNNVYLCKPQFNYIKWGLRGSKLHRYVLETVLEFSCISGSIFLEWWK